MSPREPVSNPEIFGSPAESGQVGVFGGERPIPGKRIAGDNDEAVHGAGEIPWRTSRRLQEATYRLIRERDGRVEMNHSHGDSEKNYDSPPSFNLSVRSAKGRAGHYSPEPIVREDQKDVQVQLEPGANGAPLPDGDAEKIEGVEVRTRRKRKRKVQFDDPLYFRSHGNDPGVAKPSSSSEVVENLKPAASNLGRSEAQPSRITALSKSRVVNNGPQSCFDLYCSYISPKGWRCYRSCIAGQSFCTFHRSPSTEPKAVVSLCT